MSLDKAANPENTEIAGRYQVIQKLGAGAFGTVYKAKDKILGRMVAIKTIRLEGLAAAGAGLEELIARFKREAQVAAQLKHPNIVTIYDIGDVEGLTYMAMEFIDGVGLEKVISTAGRLPMERAAMLGAQVAEALDFAHKHGVVHRDIKPANIMIEAGDRVKVTDFGIAKPMDSGDQLTATGSLLGTPSYMSPEQAKGAAVDGRSDLFALGCVIYEMLTGKKAFRGDSITALIFKIITEEPPPMTEFEPSVPAPIMALVTKALSKATDGRYQTGHEMAEALLALTQPGSSPTLRQRELSTAMMSTQVVSPAQKKAAATDAAPAPAKTVLSKPAANAPAPPAPVAPTTISKTPGAPARPQQPAASGGSAGMKIGLGLLAGMLGLFLLAGVGLGVWYFGFRKPAIPTPDPSAAVSPVASPDAGSGVQVEVVPTPEPGASIAAGTTEIAGTSAPGMTPPPVEPPITPPHANRGSAPSTNPQTAPVNTNPTTAPVQTAQNQDFSILDTPQEDTADGTEAGQRLAEQYGRGRTPSGPRARFQKRARFPHPLGQTEKPAVATLLYVINAQEAYHRKHGRYGTLNELMTARSLFLDVSVRTSSFERRGYRFEVTNQSDGFEITATPMSAGPRPFIGDDSGFVRVGTD